MPGRVAQFSHYRPVRATARDGLRGDAVTYEKPLDLPPGHEGLLQPHSSNRVIQFCTLPARQARHCSVASAVRSQVAAASRWRRLQSTEATASQYASASGPHGTFGPRGAQGRTKRARASGPSCCEIMGAVLASVNRRAKVRRTAHRAVRGRGREQDQDYCGRSVLRGSL